MIKKVTILLIAVFVSACGHTNNLDNYILRGKKAFYETRISPEARVININIEKGSKKEDKKEKSDLEKFLETGSDILSAQKIGELKDYVDTETLAYNITATMEDALITFLDIITLERKTEQPNFLVRIDLKNCTLNINPVRSNVNLFVTAEIIDRKSGGTVWENWETYTIFLDEENRFSGDIKTSTERKVTTAVQLLGMSKTEIQSYVNYLSETVGEMMADTFRKDYNEAMKNKVFEDK